MAAAVELYDVTRNYRMGDEVIHALDRVSVTIGSGEFVAITGPSGSGKSTLANIIGGLDVPDSGTVAVGGMQLSQARDRELSAYRNQTIGFVFQSFNLQPTATALENVMMPLTLARVPARRRRARATECLAQVGLGDRMRHKPTQLSGGQRQRVAIARALATEPNIIIADEPTGNLDSERGREIIELLKRLNAGGITLIIITHEAEIADIAGRVLHIKDGRLTIVSGSGGPAAGGFAAGPAAGGSAGFAGGGSAGFAGGRPDDAGGRAAGGSAGFAGGPAAGGRPSEWSN
ncbi:MAG: hypothetical protein AUI14_26530 [Actinobacteria bacterium 13_2_20CM_2_71_6]|nr:MAG: hypothetical protein AUI14_26530 [Actinobacteria bacterium 13_2_20CM_2_71_6]